MGVGGQPWKVKLTPAEDGPAYLEDLKAEKKTAIAKVVASVTTVVLLARPAVHISKITVKGGEVQVFGPDGELITDLPADVKCVLKMQGALFAAQFAAGQQTAALLETEDSAKAAENLSRNDLLVLRDTLMYAAAGSGRSVPPAFANYMLYLSAKLAERGHDGAVATQRAVNEAAVHGTQSELANDLALLRHDGSDVFTALNAVGVYELPVFPDLRCRVQRVQRLHDDATAAPIVVPAADGQVTVGVGVLRELGEGEDKYRHWTTYVPVLDEDGVTVSAWLHYDPADEGSPMVVKDPDFRASLAGGTMEVVSLHLPDEVARPGLPRKGGNVSYPRVAQADQQCGHASAVQLELILRRCEALEARRRAEAGRGAVSIRPARRLMSHL